ncbi:MAG TPA: adenylate/guanylate cyclase domain-containing protein [Actinomycetota bacterium]|jgi:class 3 adenylate cyclase|nr:adenylate/guanylate cyclase domain-containing protein [Actinomycetota bacterium]
MNGLSAAGLADLAGVTEAEVQRLVDLGILVARDRAGPFLAADAQKIRLATACEQAGLPMAGIAAAIRAGRLSFAFLEAAPYRRWAVRSGRTYRQVSQETGVPLGLLGSFLEAIGFARMAPDEPIREDELEIVPLLQLGLASGILDQVWSTRLGRGYAEGLRLLAGVEKDVWRARFMAPLLASGADQQTARTRAAQLSGDFLPVVDRALLAAYRRQQELSWIEDLVEEIETALEETGVLGRPERVPAMCFLDLVGYTRLTEEHGDQVAAELAETLAVLVNRFSREHGGVPVKWLGDGVMVHFREPAGAVLAALQLVEEVPEAGLPPAHVGVAAGPVVIQAGDYFGRTVNLAARIAAYASASRVLVSERVAERAPPQGVTFAELGRVQLEGIAHPVRLLEARRA